MIIICMYIYICIIRGTSNLFLKIKEKIKRALSHVQPRNFITAIPSSRVHNLPPQ